MPDGEQAAQKPKTATAQKKDGISLLFGRLE